MKLIIITILFGMLLETSFANALTVKNESKIEQEINVSVNSGGNVTTEESDISTGDVKTEITSQTVVNGQAVESINESYSAKASQDELKSSEVYEHTDEGVHVKTEIKVEHNTNDANRDSAPILTKEGVGGGYEIDVQDDETPPRSSPSQGEDNKKEPDKADGSDNILITVLAFFENIFSRVVNWFSRVV